MVNMALSAMIKPTMPTRPFDNEGKASPWGERVSTVASIAWQQELFVFPIRVRRMFKVPERATAPYGGSLGEVVFGRWRTGCPLQSPGIPRIIPGRPAL